MPSSDTMKQCPYCREWIPLRVRFCSYCEKDLRDAEAEAIAERPRRSQSLRRDDPRDDERASRRSRDRDDDWDDDYDDRPRRRAPRQGPYVDCPHCGCPGFAERVTFTWWGGLIGPAMLSHVRCQKCRRGYNGKSGKDNTTAIA